MKAILDWLRHVEDLAREFYAEAAERFSDDETFSAFLSQLADDEEHHADLIGKATALLDESGNMPKSAIGLDDDMKARVLAPMSDSLAELREDGADKAAFLSRVVEVELSEWNDVFLYAIRACQPHSRMFQRLASSVQEHESRVDAFIARIPVDVRPVRGVKDLPSIWERRYLVVDDEDALVDLYVDILSDDATVHTAHTGREGLEKVRRLFYDAIVTDYDMPDMNGLEFFRSATAEFPDATSRFIFCSADPPAEVAATCKAYGLTFIPKPFGLADVVDAVARVVQQAAAPQGK